MNTWAEFLSTKIVAQDPGSAAAHAVQRAIDGWGSYGGLTTEGEAYTALLVLGVPENVIEEWVTEWKAAHP